MVLRKIKILSEKTTFFRKRKTYAKLKFLEFSLLHVVSRFKL